VCVRERAGERKGARTTQRYHAALESITLQAGSYVSYIHMYAARGYDTSYMDFCRLHSLLPERKGGAAVRPLFLSLSLSLSLS